MMVLDVESALYENRYRYYLYTQIGQNCTMTAGGKGDYALNVFRYLFMAHFLNFTPFASI